METPEVIRHARIARGFSQAELARKLGVDTRQINRYETGATEPTLAVARRLAEHLKITMNELAGSGTPFTGTWWSAWNGLTSGRFVTGPVELSQRDQRLIIQSLLPPDTDDAAPDDAAPEITWRAEMHVDADVLLGWYKIDTPQLRARGTLNLAHRSGALDGNWLKFTLGGIKTGHIVLAPDPQAAETRLQHVLDLIAEKDGA